MNYLELYTKFIDSRMNRLLDTETKYENHHIMPRCFNGPDHPTNLIYLTRREHCFAHILLHKAFPEIQELYWPLQFFIDVMSPQAWKMFQRQRTSFWKLQDRSYLKEEWFQKNVSQTNLALWSTDTYRRNMLQLREAVTFRSKQSSTQKLVWNDRDYRNTKETKTGRFPAKKVKVNDTIYPTLSDAARANAISPKTAYDRIRKSTWPDWSYA